jgi:transcriptional regulator with XRE-family HTH domain
MTPEQCRMARAALNWTQNQLADASYVGIITIRNFELGKSQPNKSTLHLLRLALEAAGVVFTNGDEPGVKLRKMR